TTKEICLLASTTTPVGPARGLLEIYRASSLAQCDGSYNAEESIYFEGVSGAPSTIANSSLTMEIFSPDMQIRGYVQLSADYSNGTILTADSEQRATLTDTEIEDISNIGPSGNLLLVAKRATDINAAAYV